MAKRGLGPNKSIAMADGFIHADATLSGSKFCKTCGEKKANTEFHRKPNEKDGLSKFCKTCVNEAKKRKYYEKKKRSEVEQKAADKPSNTTKVLKIDGMAIESNHDESAFFDIAHFESLLGSLVRDTLGKEDEDESEKAS